MKTLITGGLGYIGTCLAERLLRQGKRIRILSLPMPIPDSLRHPRIEIVLGDIRNADDVRTALKGVDRVFHLAAYARNWAKDANLFFDINVGGTEIVLRCALDAGIRRVVVTSSNLALGPSNGAPVDENTVRRSDFLTAYERSKFATEDVARRFARRGLDVVIVNPTRVFGPGCLNEANSMTKMIVWYLQGKWRLVLGNGRAVGNYVFIDDLVSGHILAMEHGKNGENYILGGENLTFREVFDELASCLHRPYLRIHLPMSLAMPFAQFELWRGKRFGHLPLITPGWVHTFSLNWANKTEKAERELSYRVTPFRVALRRTVEWLLNQEYEIPRLIRRSATSEAAPRRGS